MILVTYDMSQTEQINRIDYLLLWAFSVLSPLSPVSSSRGPQAQDLRRSPPNSNFHFRQHESHRGYSDILLPAAGASRKMGSDGDLAGGY